MLGVKQVNEYYFDTLKVEVGDKKLIENEALKHNINFRYFPNNCVGITLDETTLAQDIHIILSIFSSVANKKIDMISVNGQENRLSGQSRRC